MPLLFLAIVLGLTFGVCFLVDKGFHKLFRNRQQHHSGKAVHLHKRYGAGGIVLTTLGVAAILTGINTDKMVLWIGGILVLCMGAALLTYYLTFGVYYDADTFLVNTFGKKGRVYRYENIKNQQLFTTAGGIVIELYMSDGTSLSLQGSMEGAYDFLDWAFHGWCRQNLIDSETCDFHKPEESCWFPPLEVE